MSAFYIGRDLVTYVSHVLACLFSFVLLTSRLFILVCSVIYLTVCFDRSICFVGFFFFCLITKGRRQPMSVSPF